MTYLDILIEPNQILRNRSKEIEDPLHSEVQDLIPVMIESMHRANGVGLAAPQIGKNIRLIIVNTKHGPLPCINPVIVKRSFFKEWMEEGCLSVPGKWGAIKRNQGVTVTFLDREGKNNTLKTSGLLAQIFQHEVDHLNGTLFIDNAKGLRDVE